MPSLASTQLPLPARFARIKGGLIEGKEDAISQSWTRLLHRLQTEIEAITARRTSVIPSIDFEEINHPNKAAEFSTRLRRTGVAVVRSVIPRDVIADWRSETLSYIGDNPIAETHLTQDNHLQPVYWSPAQVKSRAYANVLAAQKFLMTAWHSSDPEALLSTSLPVAYADRLRIRGPSASESCAKAHVDGGSVERWEPDGYGQGSTYRDIWAGAWEKYDPWESSTRLKITSDLYYGASTCSMFRMFSGWLSLGPLSSSDGTLLVCPMIQLTTAYLLLRPFFSPINQDPSHPDFLSAENWRLETPPTSVIHGAVPSYTQELSTTLHPHLQLDKTMVPIPDIEPGDYVVWHCDAVYAVDDSRPHHDVDAAVMYLPACPLTQTNALYLARQRKAFLLGLPSPDFGGGRGESFHLSRPGVQEVHDAGGDDGLRAMGLLPWDPDDMDDEVDVDVVDMANSILFPDMYD